MNLSFLPTLLLLWCQFPFLVAIRRDSPNYGDLENDKIDYDYITLCYPCGDPNKKVTKAANQLRVGYDRVNKTCGEWEQIGTTFQLRKFDCFLVQREIQSNPDICGCAIPAAKNPTNSPTRATPFPTRAPFTKAPTSAPTIAPTRCNTHFYLITYFGDPRQVLSCGEDTINYNDVSGQNRTVALAFHPSSVADDANITSVALSLDGITTSVQDVYPEYTTLYLYGLFGARDDEPFLFKDWTDVAQNKTYTITATLLDITEAVYAEYEITIHMM